MCLDELYDADDSSRLSCQILTRPQTDRLVISLAADSVQQSPVLTDDVSDRNGSMVAVTHRFRALDTSPRTRGIPNRRELAGARVAIFHHDLAFGQRNGYVRLQ